MSHFCRRWVIIETMMIASEFLLNNPREEKLDENFTRFPLFPIAFENVLRAFHPKRSSKDSTDFRARLYRFPVRQEEVLYQRKIHASMFHSQLINLINIAPD